MIFNARDVRWLKVAIKGVEGYFCDVRVDRRTIPVRFQVWELADGGGDGIVSRYRLWIMVDFWGTFITEGRLPVVTQDIWEDSLEEMGEWRVLEERSVTFEEVINNTGGEAQNETIWVCPDINSETEYGKASA